MGRPSGYSPKIKEELLKYFRVEFEREVEEEQATARGDVVKLKKRKGNWLPTVEGFVDHMDIAKSTFYDWVKANPELSDALKRAQSAQMNILIQNTLNGNYHAGFAKFLAMNISDYRDKVETEVKGDIKVEFPDERAAKL